MGANTISRRNRIAEALLGIYEAQVIIREDQKLFQKTLSDLKSRVDFISKKHEDSSCCPNEQGLNKTFHRS